MPAAQRTRAGHFLLVAVVVVLGLLVAAVGGAGLHRLTASSTSPPKVPVTTTTVVVVPGEVSSAQQILDAHASDAVVQVTTQRCEGFGNGSGVLVGPDLVVTAAHVIFDGSVFFVSTRTAAMRPAQVVVYAPELDLAVLRVAGLPPVAMPALADDLRSSAGSVLNRTNSGVEAHPFAVAKREVATVPRVGSAVAGDRSVIVMAVRLAPGDSGGPLIDEEGRLAGIAFGVDRGDKSIGYASPAASVRTVLSRVGAPTGFVPPTCGIKLAPG